MIRPTTPDDLAAIIAIAEAIGFQPDELEELNKMLADHLGGNSNNDDFWITDDEDGPIGVAYCSPERMTKGTWNLLFIAIHPDRQGQGRGTALMHHVEQMLVAQGARLLLVETLASFDRTRAFYRKCGYDEEACIRDFYEAGADKIVYRKVLATQE